MNILIIGANGGIGKQTVMQAIDSGHRVTAILRNPANLGIRHPNLVIIQGDIMKSESFEKHLGGVDIVISAIGGKMNKPTTLYSEGNKVLLASMKRKGISRAYFISASAIEISPENPFIVRLAARYIVQKLFSHGYADQRKMEQIIRETDINWTILRPPRLTNQPITGKYRFAVNRYLKNCLKISRADVAHFMLEHVTDAATYKGVIELAY